MCVCVCMNHTKDRTVRISALVFEILFSLSAQYDLTYIQDLLRF